jgi:hypothetical protein
MEDALGIDLSLFSKLSVLRVHISSFVMAYDTLSTITSSSHGQRINLYFPYPTVNTCAQLDCMLVPLSLDSLLTVEL